MSITPMVNSEAELKSAIEGLYGTFSRYPLPERIDAAPSVSAADQALLYSKDLRDLGCDELVQYSFDALTTWGWTDAFRHFLPRIFELIAADGDGWTVPEIVFGKLGYGHWETWPSDEREAIMVFFEALWSNVLDHFPNALSAEDCLCWIALAADDMARYLSRWRIAQSLPHAKHFAAFIANNPDWSPRHGWSLNDTYWRERPVAARQVVEWLRDPARKTEMDQAFFQFARDGEDTAVLSKAADDLARLS
jgi:hypothetical protein